MILYGCCVGSWDKFNRYVKPQTEDRWVLTKFGYPGIVQAYNELLDEAARIGDVEALILLHDDLEYLDPDAEAKLVAPLADDSVAMVGVCGGGGDSIYWWNHSPVGHQQTNHRLIDFGPRTGDVTLLEGSCLVLAPWVFQNLRFDPRFEHWHGYDEIGMQVKAAGKRAVVVDVDTWHHNNEGYPSQESADQCVLANKLYQEKWGLA